jgi:hypothetical protein
VSESVISTLPVLGIQSASPCDAVNMRQSIAAPYSHTWRTSILTGSMAYSTARL